jgi:hypothetical protein
VLALLILIGTAGVVAGWVVEELGQSSDTSGWAKILGFGTAVTNFWMLAAVLTGLMLVLILRVVFTWPERTPSALARTTLGLVVIVASSIAVAAVLGIVATYASTSGDASVPGASKAGITIVFAAEFLVSVTIAVFGIFGFSAIKTLAAPEPMVPSAAAVA